MMMGGDGTKSLVSFQAVSGTIYSIAVDGFNSTATGSIVLHLQLSQSYSLTVNKTGTGTGTVTVIRPASTAGRIAVENYTSGTEVTLTADPGQRLNLCRLGRGMQRYGYLHSDLEPGSGGDGDF